MRTAICTDIAGITRSPNISARPSNRCTPLWHRKTSAPSTYAPRVQSRVVPLSRTTPHANLTSGAATFLFYRGDCIEILETFDEQSVDAIVTSPPYNLGVRYRSYDDTIPREQYLTWTA